MLVLSGALAWWAGRGSDDPFVHDLREIAATYFRVYQSNALIVTIFAALVAASGPVLNMIERRLEPSPLEEDEEVELVRGPRR
jgi:hypothetical protein